MKPHRGPPGTKDKPLEVLSIYEDRIIGCVCKCPSCTHTFFDGLTDNKCGYFTSCIVYFQTLYG